MSTQLDLFAPPAEAIALSPTPEILFRGAKAAGVPAHAHAPLPRPRSMHTDDEWMLVLRVAEECIRWRCWTRPHPLPLDSRPDDCVGGAGDHWYDSKGVTLERAVAGGRCASWPVLLRGLREQREHEPHIADARDLAAAYHALETYDRYYVRDGGEVVSPGRDDWRERVAIPHLEALRGIVVVLGGVPDLVAA